MNFRTKSLALLLPLTAQVAWIPAFADPVSFAPPKDGTSANLTADLKVRSIGKILLQKGAVSFSGNSLTVTSVPDWMFDGDEVLTGVVIDPQIGAPTSEGGSSMISGLAYFTKGSYLQNLGNRSLDTFTLANGTTVLGNVAGTTETIIDVVVGSGHHESIPIADIKNVVSNRAFRFSIPASGVKIEPTTGGFSGEAGLISFAPQRLNGGVLASNKAKVPQSNLPGTEGGISNKAIAAYLAMDIVMELAPAIAAPIIFTRPHKTDSQLLFQGQNNSVGQPIGSPQIWNNGTIHFYPQ